MKLPPYDPNNFLLVALSYFLGLIPHVVIALLLIGVLLIIFRIIHRKPNLFQRPFLLLVLILTITEIWIAEIIAFFSLQIYRLLTIADIFFVLNIMINGVIIFGLWRNKKLGVIGMFVFEILVNFEYVFTKNWTYVPLMLFVLPLLLLPFFPKME